MSRLTDTLPPVNFGSLNGVNHTLPIVNPPFDFEGWRISRFAGTPPPMKYLVRDFIPAGIAGCLYSPGGTGKSTLALDLAIRVAIAPIISSLWLGTFPVTLGGTVVYFSAEEPEDVLHRRFQSLCNAIAEENLVRNDLVFAEAEKNLFLANLWGKVNTLFDITNTSLVASDEYRKVQDVLEKLKDRGPVRLIVIDTRSRFSGAEGAGNALVSREVALFEKLAFESGATVLILHHTNKASLQGGNAMAAQRGESALLDCLRFGIYLQTLSEEAARAQGISDEDRKKYLVITNSKQNYSEIQGPVVVRREGFQFSKSDALPKGKVGAKSDLREKAEMDAMMKMIRINPGLSQIKLVQAAQQLPQTISMKRGREALRNLEDLEMVRVLDGPRKAKLYFQAGEEVPEEMTT